MEIKDVAVVGAGTMGAGIASVLLASNLFVHVVDISEEMLRKCRATIEKNLSYRVSKQLMTEEGKADTLDRVRFGVDLHEAASSQLVIEAVSENLDLKRKVFSTLADIVQPDTILATNTSALSISELSTATKYPDKFLGIHFFNPAPVMKLVELVRGPATSEDTMGAAEAFVRTLGKESVRVGESPGFVVNRILIPMINEAARLVGEGVASAVDIDTALKLGANHPIGPLALGDLIGLDVCLAIMETLHTGLRSDAYAPAPMLRELVAAGKLGRKSGAGFFEYS